MPVAAARMPDMAQTMVEVRRTEMPKVRAESALEADARTAMPKRVLVRKIVSATMSTGTTTNTSTSLGKMRRSSVGRFTEKSNGRGMPPGATTWGRLILKTTSSCEMPMVAMSSTRRGDSNSLRMKTISMTAAIAAPAANVKAKANHQGMP